jgi:hypothetical protein
MKTLECAKFDKNGQKVVFANVKYCSKALSQAEQGQFLEK